VNGIYIDVQQFIAM